MASATSVAGHDHGRATFDSPCIAASDLLAVRAGLQESWFNAGTDSQRRRRKFPIRKT